VLAGPASNPNPANGAANVPLSASLSWVPGANATLHRVYLGTSSNAVANATTNSPEESLAAKLRANGLQLADSNLVAQFFHDPRRGQDGGIFIDARDDEHYAAGHIPGAYHFYHFHPENYLSNVVQVCMSAEQIVFYCNGGDCEDSEHAAITLRDSLGVPKERVFVYGGGMTEWTANGLPIEVGARNSGVLTNATQSATSGNVEGANR